MILQYHHTRHNPDTHNEVQWMFYAKDTQCDINDECL